MIEKKKFSLVIPRASKNAEKDQETIFKNYNQPSISVEQL